MYSAVAKLSLIHTRKSYIRESRAYASVWWQGFDLYVAVVTVLDMLEKNLFLVYSRNSTYT